MLKPMCLRFVLAVAVLLGACYPALCADSLEFKLRWEYPTLPFQSLSIEYDKLDRPYFYMTTIEGGLLVFDASNPQQPKLVKTLPVSDLTSLHVMNVYQQGSFLYLALGGHYGGDQQEKGLGVIDVSDPPNATVTDVWHTAPGNGSGIVIVEGDYAYLGAMSQGLVILDVSNKNDVRFVSQIIPDINFPWPNPTPNQRAKINARGMALQDDILYLCYDAGGLRVIDVSDKSNPREAGRYLNDAVELMAYNNIALKGNLAYITIDYCGLEILDISDNTNIVQVSWWNPWESDHPQDWYNSEGHANEIVFHNELDLVFLASGDSELSVVDVADPFRPRLAGSFGQLKNMQGTWGVEVHRQQVFLTYVRSFAPPFGPYPSNWAGVKLLEWDFSVKVKESRESSRLPLTPSLHQNYPNPFNPSTEIHFGLPTTAQVTLTIFNMLGQEVRTLLDRRFEAGQHQIVWDGRDEVGRQVSSGVYLLQMRAAKAGAHAEFLQVRKMLLIE